MCDSSADNSQHDITDPLDSTSTEVDEEIEGWWGFYHNRRPPTQALRAPIPEEPSGGPRT